MRILFVAHGFPPRESAGTEQHVAALAAEAVRSGHTVQVLAATRSAGHRPWAVWSEVQGGIPITRVVNNLPARPLSDRESDGIIDRIAAEVVRDFRPDVVHIHHLQFLSSTVDWQAPVVVTLHDQWFWCPAGGLGIRAAGQPCDGPDPAHCPSCSARWHPSPDRLTRLLARTARAAAPVVSPHVLHKLWQAVPHRFRPTPERGQQPIPSGTALTQRNASMQKVLQDAHTVLSPSRWLADRCHKVTGRRARVIRHGLSDFWTAPPSDKERSTVLFLGTIVAHKGPSEVIRAWRQACPDGTPPLRVHGPIQDASLLLQHPAGGPLDRGGVRRALDTARVLVMASTWPENAPLVILEARARGCPIVAPRVGGIPELVSSEDGILVDPADPTALAAALREALDAPHWAPRPPPTLAQQAREVFAVLEEAACR